MHVSTHPFNFNCVNLFLNAYLYLSVSLIMFDNQPVLSNEGKSFAHEKNRSPPFTVYLTHNWLMPVSREFEPCQVTLWYKQLLYGWHFLYLIMSNDLDRNNRKRCILYVRFLISDEKNQSKKEILRQKVRKLINEFNTFDFQFIAKICP